MRFGVIILALSIAAWAQTAPAPPKSVSGVVTAIDATSGSLTVKADAGADYSVKTGEATRFYRVPLGVTDLKQATKIALADISVGDRVQAIGAVSEESKTVTARGVVMMSKADVAKKQSEDRQAWQQGVSGVVAAVSPDAKEITLTVRGAGAESKSIVVEAAGVSRFLRYSQESVKFSDAAPGSFAEIHVGDNLRAKGARNEDGTRFKADEIIAGAFQTVAATVVSVDAAGGTLRLNDLQSKKQITVATTADTLERKLPPMMAAMLARRLHGAAGTGAPGQDGPGRSGGAADGSADRAAGGRGDSQGRGGPGGPGGRGNFDLQQALERAPALALADLKPGDALIIQSAKVPDGARLMAFSLIAGVEPILQAAPRSAGQVNLGNWNLDIGGVPEQ
jgi:hypothetical protein